MFECYLKPERFVTIHTQHGAPSASLLPRVLIRLPGTWLTAPPFVLRMFGEDPMERAEAEFTQKGRCAGNHTPHNDAVEKKKDDRLGDA